MKRNAPDVENASLYVAAPHGAQADTTLFLECERWVDARNVARRVLGGEVQVVKLDAQAMRKLPCPRVQVRWVGSAARRVPDLRMQTRRIAKSGKPGRWQDLS